MTEEYIEKTKLAIERSQFWEILDAPVTIQLARRFAEIEGRKVPKAMREAAKRVVIRVNNPKACKYLLDIAYASKPDRELEAFLSFRDKLIEKVASEFVELDKAGSVKEYCDKRNKRIAIGAVL